MRLGIDKLFGDSKPLKTLKNKRLALLGHPASFSLEPDFVHSADRIAQCEDLTLSCLFGPQHGIRGEKQDNMIESDDFVDSKLGVPVFSLYGETRRPTDSMIENFDVLLVDLQDIGCRIYTYLTTVAYFLEALSGKDKEIWILDRPNPVGRLVEGLSLKKGQESFVGCAPIPMRHGLTLGEFSKFYVDHGSLDVNLTVVAMEGYDPAAKPGFGWDEQRLPWVNPSPNIPSLSAARVFPGAVMLEGTVLSEGRGTTRPFELIGAPDLPIQEILEEMKSMDSEVFNGCAVRPCFFEPTFQKHVEKLCNGIQLHVDPCFFNYEKFRPYWIMACFLKSVKKITGMSLWRDFDYEYEPGRLAIDVICGGNQLRTWVDDVSASAADFKKLVDADCSAWEKARAAFVMYGR